MNPDVRDTSPTFARRLLAKDPAERYDSIRDLARDLGSVLDGLSRRTPADSTAGVGKSAPDQP